MFWDEGMNPITMEKVPRWYNPVHDTYVGYKQVDLGYRVRESAFQGIVRTASEGRINGGKCHGYSGGNVRETLRKFEPKKPSRLFMNRWHEIEHNKMKEKQDINQFKLWNNEHTR